MQDFNDHQSDNDPPMQCSLIDGHLITHFVAWVSLQYHTPFRFWRITFLISWALKQSTMIANLPFEKAVFIPLPQLNASVMSLPSQPHHHHHWNSRSWFVVSFTVFDCSCLVKVLPLLAQTISRPLAHRHLSSSHFSPSAGKKWRRSNWWVFTAHFFSFIIFSPSIF